MVVFSNKQREGVKYNAGDKQLERPKHQIPILYH